MSGALRRNGRAEQHSAQADTPGNLAQAWRDRGYELRATQGGTFYAAATFPEWVFIVRHHQGGRRPPSPTEPCRIMVKDREAGELLAHEKQATNVSMLNQVIRDWRRTLARERNLVAEARPAFGKGVRA